MSSRTGQPHVQVVLPCLDEAAAIPGVLAGVPPEYGVIVADNGSSDGTPEIAARLGATVVYEPHRGYGAAVHAGVLACDAEVVAVMDADGSLDPSALPGLVATVQSGEADLAVGRRRAVTRRSWPWHARLGNSLLSALLRRRGIPVHDIAPIRVMHRRELLEMNIVDRGFGYPLELLVRAGKSDLRVKESLVDYRPRVAGTKSKVSGSVRGTARAVRDMSQVLERFPR